MSVNVTRRIAGAGLLFGIAAASAPAFAQSARFSMRDKIAVDRHAILQMAGDFHVRFDFRETTPFLSDYTPIAPHVVSGNEIVRVVTDRPDLIQLQHILIAEAEGQNVIVKHWRQDWTYQPRTVVAYERMNYWALNDVPRQSRSGAWSQTVWQTDDSPRYGGVGLWSHDDGVSSWTSEPTVRPLARRDAVRHPLYDHYRGINRHSITPTGWVHEQDNAKIGMHNGAVATFVHESVVNTYDRATDFPIAAGDAYWRDTQSYWAAVRAQWDHAISARRGLTLAEEAENGSITGPQLMGLADAIHAGQTTIAAAIPQSERIIRDATNLAARAAGH
jgi:hypothetical protein